MDRSFSREIPEGFDEAVDEEAVDEEAVDEEAVDKKAVDEKAYAEPDETDMNACLNMYYAVAQK